MLLKVEKCCNTELFFLKFIAIYVFFQCIMTLLIKSKYQWAIQPELSENAFKNYLCNVCLYIYINCMYEIFFQMCLIAV